MIDKTKKYKTRDGRGVRIYAAATETGLLTHGAVDLDSVGEFTICSWTAEGRYCTPLAHHFDLLPVPVLRPWTHGECPVVFIARKKVAPGGMSATARRHYLPTCQGVNFFPAKVDDGDKLVIDLSFSDLAADYVRILEDGSEVPCGVEE